MSGERMEIEILHVDPMVARCYRDSALQENRWDISRDMREVAHEDLPEVAASLTKLGLADLASDVTRCRADIEGMTDRTTALPRPTSTLLGLLAVDVQGVASRLELVARHLDAIGDGLQATKGLDTAEAETVRARWTWAAPMVRELERAHQQARAATRTISRLARRLRWEESRLEDLEDERATEEVAGPQRSAGPKWPALEASDAIQAGRAAQQDGAGMARRGVLPEGHAPAGPVGLGSARTSALLRRPQGPAGGRPAGMDPDTLTGWPDPAACAAEVEVVSPVAVLKATELLEELHVGLACGHVAPRPGEKQLPRTLACWSCAEGRPPDRAYIEAALEDASTADLEVLASVIARRTRRSA